MPTQRRHGLPTLVLPGDPAAFTDHLLTGRKTVVVRPVVAHPGPLERAGDRVLLVDAAGRSLAVADVVSATLTVLSQVDAPTRCADDPDHVDAGQWSRATLARWRRAGLLGDGDLPEPGTWTDPVVSVVGIHVVGLENPAAVTRRARR